MPDARHAILFEPIAIGPKVLKNRFYQVPHGPSFGNERWASRARYSEMKAEGGWAAVNTGLCLTSPDSDIIPVVVERLWTERDALTMRGLCEGIHKHGALAGVELGHAGNDASARGSRWPIISASQLASDLHPMRVPKAMDPEDIERVQSDWVRAAELAVTAGFDIVYVYGAHSHLPGQFLSEFYNHRNDGYGGSLANRMRFWLETIERVRGAVGNRCAVAVRIGVQAASIAIEDTLRFISSADPLVDLWDVNLGGIAEWWRDSGSSRFFEQGYQLEWTGRVRAVTKKPIVGVGRLTDPDRMAEIVRGGAWDLVGAARPAIADPFLPRKIEEGRIGEIRECIGCNICIAMTQKSYLSCTQNPTAGEEFRRNWHPERVPRSRNSASSVLVVGAGPAGLECAMVLGQRGMSNVHLLDDHNEMGGHLRWATRLPGLGPWRRVIEWRREKIRHLRNVEFHPRNAVSSRFAFEYGADYVVIATGSVWASDGLNATTHRPIPGTRQAHVLTPELIMEGPADLTGRRVVVYDAEGYFVGAGIADVLAERNTVQLVTNLTEVAPFCDETLEGDLLRRRLHERGVALDRRLTLLEIGESSVVLQGEFGEVVTIECDAVVLVTQRISQDDLYHDLRRIVAETGEGPVVLRIGDCVTPRLIADAIFDGHRLAMDIDNSKPAVPSPIRHDTEEVLEVAVRRGSR